MTKYTVQTQDAKTGEIKVEMKEMTLRPPIVHHDIIVNLEEVDRLVKYAKAQGWI